MFNAAICLIFFSGIFLTNYTQLICVKVKNLKCFPHDYASSIFFILYNFIYFVVTLNY